MAVGSMALGGERQEQTRCATFCQGQFEIVCFSGDSTVMVRDRGRLPIADLKQGDLVLAAVPREGGGWKMCFDPVVAFLHYAPSHEGPALRIEHELGHLELTSTHFVLVEKPGSSTGAVPLMAKEVSVGDRLLAPWVDGSLTSPKVTHIEQVWRKGFFAPLTCCGTLLVDGTAASCFAIPGNIVESPNYQQLVELVGASNVHSLCQALSLPLRAAHRLSLQDDPACKWAALETETSKTIEFFHPYMWFCYILGANTLVA